tara:strand:- start:1337 stop:3688 length:2352 start_codon:yes stop_codon:yes gene_type:complete
LAIQAFSGGIQQLPTPDFNLTSNIAEGDILVYRTATKSFDNTTGAFTTLAQVNSLIAAIQAGGGVDLSNYVTDAELNSNTATLTASIALKAASTYVDAQIAAIVHPATDLSTYVTSSALAASLTNYDTSGVITSKINTAVANATFFDGDYNNLTNTPAIPSLTGYATQLWTQAQIANHVVDLSDYATITSLTTSIANFVTESVIDTKISTAVTGGVNLADYALTTAVDTAIAVETTRALAAESTLTQNVTSNATAIAANTASIAAEAITARAAEGANSAAITALVIPTDVSDLTDSTSLLGSGGATALSGLTDVSTSGVTTGQVLKYNGTSWAPAADDISGGGGSNADTLDSQDGTWYLDWTNTTNKPSIPTDVSDLTDSTSLLAHTDITALQASVSTNATAIAAETTARTAAIAALVIPAAYTNTDVDSHLNLSGATSGQVLGYNGTDYAWVANSSGGGGSTTLSGLTDVSSTTPTTGYVLKWNGSAWAPAVDATTGISGSSYATEAYVDQKLVERGMHFSGNYNDLTNLPALFSGSFPDLNNKPTTLSGYGITDSPTSLLDLSISDGTVGQVLVTDGLGNFSFTNGTGFSGDYNALTNLPSLFSGNYNDLSNKPYVPSIAGLASTSYVDAKHAEADIAGDKFFQNNVSQVTKVSNVVAASHDNYVLSIITTNAAPTEALLSSASRIVIDTNSTVMYKIHIVASDGTDQLGVRKQGLIDRTGASPVALLGSPSTEILVDTSNVWEGNVTADTVNNSLKVSVTGDTGKTVQWTIFVELNAVKR